MSGWAAKPKPGLENVKRERASDFRLQIYQKQRDEDPSYLEHEVAHQILHGPTRTLRCLCLQDWVAVMLLQIYKETHKGHNTAWDSQNKK